MCAGRVSLGELWGSDKLLPTLSISIENVVVLCSVAKLKVEDVIGKLIPFFGAIVVALLFVTFVPAISTWLPTVLGLM